MKEKMKRSLDSVKSKVNTKKDDVLDRLYGASNHLLGHGLRKKFIIRREFKPCVNLFSF